MLNWENNMKKSELKSLVQEVIKETKTSKKVITETPQRTALKKLIKETIGAMGYVDIGAVGSPIPVSNNAVNALLGRKRRVVKEDRNPEPDYETFNSKLETFDDDLKGFLGEIDDWTEGNSANNQCMKIGKQLQILIGHLLGELLHNI